MHKKKKKTFLTISSGFFRRLTRKQELLKSLFLFYGLMTRVEKGWYISSKFPEIFQNPWKITQESWKVPQISGMFPKCTGNVPTFYNPIND